MTNEEKACRLAVKNIGGDTNHLYQDIRNACMKMAEWKDNQVNGFIFELSLLLCTPKTDSDKAMAYAFPMCGLDAVDSVGDWLRGKYFQYKNEGTILKQTTEGE